MYLLWLLNFSIHFVSRITQALNRHYVLTKVVALSAWFLHPSDKTVLAVDELCQSIVRIPTAETMPYFQQLSRRDSTTEWNLVCGYVTHDRSHQTAWFCEGRPSEIEGSRRPEAKCRGACWDYLHIMSSRNFAKISVIVYINRGIVNLRLIRVTA